MAPAINPRLLLGASAAVLLSFVIGRSYADFPPWLSVVQILVALFCFHSLLISTFLPAILKASVTWSSTTLDDKAVAIFSAELSPTGSTLGPALGRLGHIYIALYVASLQLPSLFIHAHTFPRALFIVIFTWRVLSIFWRLLRLVCTEALPQTDFAVAKGITAASVESVLRVLRMAYWAFASLLLADNLGFKVGSILASAGIGGMAIALAAQHVLQDLIAAAALVLDNTLGSGGFVTVGDVSGFVLSRGWKATRILTPTGHVVNLANTAVASSKVTTYPAKPDRSEAIAIRLDVETAVDELEGLAARVEEVVAGVSHANFESCFLMTVAADAMVFDIIVQFPASDHADYSSALHEVNLGIIKLLRERKLRFASPRNVVFSESRS